MSEDGKVVGFNQPPYVQGIDTPERNGEVEQALEEIKAKHAEIRGRIGDPYLHVGTAVVVPREMQMTMNQLDLHTMAADRHGRLWSEQADGWVLIADFGHHRMGGRLRSMSEPPAEKLMTAVGLEMPLEMAKWIKPAAVCDIPETSGQQFKDAVADAVAKIPGSYIVESPIGHYRTKQEIVEAWQFKPSPLADWPQWVKRELRNGNIHSHPGMLTVLTKGGTKPVVGGTWVIKDYRGQLDTCAEVEFAKRYDPVLDHDAAG